MTDREEFEAWISGCIEPNGFTQLTTYEWMNQRWAGWQAAKAQDRDVMQQALRALESLFTLGGVGVWKLGGSMLPRDAIAALKKVLEQS